MSVCYDKIRFFTLYAPQSHFLRFALEYGKEYNIARPAAKGVPYNRRAKYSLGTDGDRVGGLLSQTPQSTPERINQFALLQSGRQ